MWPRSTKCSTNERRIAAESIRESIGRRFRRPARRPSAILSGMLGEDDTLDRLSRSERQTARASSRSTTTS